MSCRLLSATALALALGLGVWGALSSGPPAQADDQPAQLERSEAQVAHGLIAMVNLKEDQFDLQTEDGQSFTFTVTDDTAYTIDGEEASKKKALKEGHHALVEHEDYKALSVAITSEKPDESD